MGPLLAGGGGRALRRLLGGAKFGSKTERVLRAFREKFHK